MKVAEVVVRILEDEGIDAAFGIPGAAINPVYKYLKDSRIRHYIARHEEGAVHAADGYCRASGRMALAICTSGPAATNFVTGLYTARADSVPLIAITGQAASSILSIESFQCVDIAAIARPSPKAHGASPIRPKSPQVMREAFRTARSGRPGPVLIDLPLDVQMAEVDYHPEKDQPLPWSIPAPSRRPSRKAMDLIIASKAPIMILGGGVILSDATAEFRALAEYLANPRHHDLHGQGRLALRPSAQRRPCRHPGGPAHRQPVLSWNPTS